MTDFCSADVSEGTLAPGISDVTIRLQKLHGRVAQATQAAQPQADHPPRSSQRRDDENASFHLGMELFGQEKCVLERNVQTKLEGLQQELDRILASAERDGGSSRDHACMADSTGEVGDSTNDSVTGVPATLDPIHESQFLHRRIAILKQCSTARAHLDESQSLSSDAPGSCATMMMRNAVDGEEGAVEKDSSSSTHLQAAHEALLQSQAASAEAHRLLLQSQPPSSLPLERPKSVDAEDDTADNTTTVSIPHDDWVWSVWESLGHAQRQQTVHLTGVASSVWHACVRVSSQSLVVRTAPGLAVAYDILSKREASSTSSDDDDSSSDSILQWTLRKFALTLQTDIFQAILKAPGPYTFHETQDRGTSSSRGTSTTVTTLTKGPVRRLEWTCDEKDQVTQKSHSDPSSAVAAWKDRFEAIQRVLKFCVDHVLLQQEDLVSTVGQRLFGKPNALPAALNLQALGIESCRLGDDQGMLLVPLMEALETMCVPRMLEASQLERLRVLAAELQTSLGPFEDALTDMKLLPLDGKTRISSFTASFERMYVDYRRCALLNEARDMLTSNDYHNTVRVGSPFRQANDGSQELGISDGMDVFRFHEASVSDTANKLIELCRRIMEEAVQQGTVTLPSSPLSVLPATLYRTAREVLDLFRAIIPVTHGNEVANVPRTAAVLHNDCVFMAHHCLTLGLEYKDKFPSVAEDDTRGKLLRQTCIFVDMVPLFRDLADRCLGTMLDKQAKQLVELVGERISLMGEAMRSDEILAEWSDAENALSAGLYHMRHIFHSWKPILSHDILNRSMCFLADVMFTIFLDQISKASDVSASACQFVHTLFGKAILDLSALLDDTSSSRVWERFEAIGHFMDMSMADIGVALGDGVFRCVTGPELSRLVTSCFDSSPKRQALLHILSSNP